MVRQTKEERLRFTEDEALKLGLPQRHAHALASVSVRKGLDKVIRNLLSPRPNTYLDMIQAHNKMNEDSFAFYRMHMSAQYVGNRKFSRYGHLSYMYSFASPMQLIYVLLEDAKAVQAIARMNRELDVEGSDRGRKLDYDVGLEVEELRFDKLERAFRQDLLGNYIPSDVAETLLDALDWKNCPVVDYYGGTVGTSKMIIMDAFYVFFSSEIGDLLLKKWNETHQRENLVDQFTYHFYNDPHINTHLIGKKPADVRTLGFEESCRAYLEGDVYDHTGKPTRRSEIDARRTQIG